MSKSSDQELARFREENAQLKKALVGLEKQLESANEANAELRKLLKDLQDKLDILIVQFKKRNRRDFGNKTERHNPRPAADSALAVEPAKPKTPAQRNHKKHILEQDLPIQPVPHSVKPEDRFVRTAISKPYRWASKLRTNSNALATRSCASSTNKRCAPVQSAKNM